MIECLRLIRAYLRLLRTDFILNAVYFIGIYDFDNLEKYLHF